MRAFFVADVEQLRRGKRYDTRGARRLHSRFGDLPAAAFTRDDDVLVASYGHWNRQLLEHEIPRDRFIQELHLAARLACLDFACVHHGKSTVPIALLRDHPARSREVAVGRHEVAAVAIRGNRSTMGSAPRSLEEEWVLISVQ